MGMRSSLATPAAELSPSQIQICFVNDELAILGVEENTGITGPAVAVGESTDTGLSGCCNPRTCETNACVCTGLASRHWRAQPARRERGSAALPT